MARSWRHIIASPYEDRGRDRLHLFVNEDPPQHLSAFLRDPEVIDAFRVPSGRLLIAGEEFVVTTQSVTDYPHMGREVEVPSGTYRLTAFRVDEDREDWIEDRFSSAVSPAEKRAWDLGNWLPTISFAVTLAALIASSFLFTRGFSLLLAGAPIAVAVLAWVWQARSRRSSAYKSAEALYRKLERELPSVVIVLQS